MWNEDRFAPIVQSLFGLSWQEYILHPLSDAYLQSIVSGIGLALIVLCILVLIKFPQWTKNIALGISFIILVFIALLYHLEKFQTAGQFFEYSLQFMTPVFLFYYFRYGSSNTFLYLLKFSIAFTFFSHGLYALGFYPVPGLFVSMTMNILHCSNTFALNFLMVVGVLDLIFSVGLFLPGRAFKISIYYCIVWGFLTAFARIVAHVDFSFLGSTLHQWWFQTLFRVPHFVIPLVVLKLINGNNAKVG